MAKKCLPKTWLPYMRCLYFFCFPNKRKPEGKGYHEFGYWETKKREEKILSNNHYPYFYTTHFGFVPNDFAGQSILDIGCGPRGSLEWAHMAKERVGLDPLADYYQRLGTREQHMSYVNAPSERIPFEDGRFQFVCSFNSLDHVDILEQSIEEIARVVKPGGFFLLLTDVNHNPTPTEPIRFSWNIVRAFTQRHFTLVEERHYERIPEGLYQSIRANTPYDETDPSERYGVLSAKFLKDLM